MTERGKTNGKKLMSPELLSNVAESIFDDFEARSNIVGLFDLALKIAKRDPKLWAELNGDNL